jgi:transcriptional regulator with XRE-family HTH domain
MAREEKPQVNPDADIDEIFRVIARRFADARKKRGLTQKELGQLAGVAQSRIFELEQGTANITVRTLINMSRLLDVDPRSLFPDVEPIEDRQVEEAAGRIRSFAEDLLQVMRALDDHSKADSKLREDIEMVVRPVRQIAGSKGGEPSAGS